MASSEEWRRSDPTHIRVGELLEISTDSYYPYDSSAEAALIDQILHEHELAARAARLEEALKTIGNYAPDYRLHGEPIRTTAIRLAEVARAALLASPDTTQRRGEG